LRNLGLSLAVLLPALALQALAENWAVLTGKVLDPSGATVSGAVVILTSREAQSQRTGRTSAEGEYSFQSLPEGEYLLTVRAPGFSTPDPHPVTLHAGEAAARNLQLEIGKISSQVEVTATATAQSADQQTKALDVVESAEFEARKQYSVVEAIRDLPGIRVQELGGPGSLARIRIRGLRPFDTSVLVDGFRFRDAASPNGEASAFIGDLMLVNSDRIEVLRGSGSSLYGTNAEGGVVNIVSDSGGGHTHGDISLDGGGLGMVRGVARLGGGFLNDRLRYSVGMADLNVTQGVNFERYRNTSGQGWLGYNLTSTILLTARVFVADTYSGLDQNPYVPDGVVLPPFGPVNAIAFQNFIPSQNDPDQSRTGGYASGLFSATQRLSPTASWRVNYQFMATDRDNRDGPAGTLFPPAWNNGNYFGGRIDTLQARTDFQLGRHNYITGGFEWEREAFDNHSTDENPDPSQRVDARLTINQRSDALFVQDNIRLFDDRLQVSLSGRTQGFSLDQPQFAGGEPLYQGIRFEAPPRAWTGDASAAWFSRRSGTKFRAHFGNGYRSPSLYERFGSSFFYGAFSAYGDPRLAPERAISFDTGFDQYLASSKVKVSGTFFYTRLQQVITFDGSITPSADPFGRWGGYANTGGGLARGFEVSVEAQPTSTTSVTAAYTYTNADERQNLYAGAGLQAIDVSKNMFVATVIQRVGRRLDLSFNLFAASDYLFPLFVGYTSRAYQFQGPVKADAAATYTVPLTETMSLRFFGRVENMLNRTYYEDGFRTPKTWAVGGVKFVF
jgi:vitamin B12 transporter